MYKLCPKCSEPFDDADRSTICPHRLIMAQADLDRKKLALDLICEQEVGKVISFAHMRGKVGEKGYNVKIIAITWDGMLELVDWSGLFSPSGFIVEDRITPPEPHDKDKSE